jgi:hypothetical protein
MTGNAIPILEAVNIAIVHLNAGRLDESQSVCDAIIRQAPRIAEAYWCLGLVHQRRGDPAQAESLIRQALRMAPGTRNFVVGLADVLRACGRWAEEQEILRENFKTEALVLPYLEMDIAYVCNLKCTACTHYSNYGIKGWVDFDEGSGWLTEWSRRVIPRRFRLLGGEPTLNPRLSDYIRFVGRLWPDCQRELVSNGFFVDRHPDLYPALAETGTMFCLTIHDRSPEYLAKANLDAIRAASQAHGFPFLVNDEGTEADFVRHYQGEGAAMTPFADGRPDESFRVCINSDCITLHLGRLWKCPPVAFLGKVDERFHILARPEWQPYAGHTGLGVDASDAEILDYIGNPHAMCGMCPSRPVPALDSRPR